MSVAFTRGSWVFDEGCTPGGMHVLCACMQLVPSFEGGSNWTVLVILLHNLKPLAPWPFPRHLPAYSNSLARSSSINMHGSLHGM